MKEDSKIYVAMDPSIVITQPETCAMQHCLEPKQERRLFAAMAMQGLLAGGRIGDFEKLIITSVTTADALISELDNER